MRTDRPPQPGKPLAKLVLSWRWVLGQHLRKTVEASVALGQRCEASCEAARLVARQDAGLRGAAIHSARVEEGSDALLGPGQDGGLLRRRRAEWVERRELLDERRGRRSRHIRRGHYAATRALKPLLEVICRSGMYVNVSQDRRGACVLDVI